MSRIDWRSLKPKTAFAALVFLVLGLDFLGMGFHVFPDLNGKDLSAGSLSQQAWGMFLSAYTFYILYKTLAENNVPEFRWGVVLLVLGFAVLRVFDVAVHNPTMRLVIFPVMIPCCVYSSRAFFRAAREPAPDRGIKLLSWVLILVNFIFLVISYRISGLGSYPF